MKVALIVILAVVVGLLVVIETGLRSLFGFGNPLIYISDDEIGYLLAPNQRTRRFGNRIEINEYSMRSGPITKTPTPSTLRVLLLGDSIANGGWWTDQANTISSLIMASSVETGNYQQFEVLNASANSWGPRNELAYLQRFGNFNAQAVVLLINTDDLFATAPTSLPVGRDRNYPDSKPPLASVEVWQRYLHKQKPIPEMKAVQQEAGDRVGFNLEAIAKIHALTRESNSKLLLVMTPLLREIGEPGPRDYEIKARQRLNEFTKIQQINYIDFLPIFNSTPNAKALYQDHIHLNLQGNQLVSKVMVRSLLEILEISPQAQ
ncbi:SGNH/GDSL hydrolase family protein [Nostoc sp. CENA67]|uniref:SGNH/GDSL hydrolase family protein n=1 Tax=Amazonocrinis nigriterrae CENA67 TaxID=2794033 RepID=A0A8J7HW57_9NOST|nr:SGNH/GDSL hydrolase family protein [Amazonocrinis nigriterrae]MBH8563474.1 SGNH/GDSL hydrolase family protein [Amazonocrinis nigriterrae CENA67]